MLTHGALLSLEAWALLWQPLLAAGHQLIAYDLRGHGHSTLGWSGFGVQAYAQDLAAVLDHFDVRQGVVVAHSTGGIGALALAVSAPTSAHARLAGQVLISTPPQGIGDSLQNRLLAPLVFSGLIHQVVRRRRAGHPVHPHPVRLPPLTRTWWSSPAASWPGHHDRRPSTHPRRVLRFDFRERLDRVTLPTLILAGSRDRSVKPAHTQALADGIPQARLQRFPGAGHLMVLERAHQIAEVSRFGQLRLSNRAAAERPAEAGSCSAQRSSCCSCALQLAGVWD